MTGTQFAKIVGWQPHPAQKEILKSEAREVVICAGRRFGKSALCGFIVAKTFVELYQEVVKGKRNSAKIWIVAPTYELADKVFTYTVNFLRKAEPRIINFVKNRPFPEIELSRDIWIQCKSAENPKSLLGEELDLLIVDEAANISSEIWFDYLLPTTASKTKQGKTIFISTPRGKNWFYDLYLQAKEKGGAFHFTSLDGVEVDKTEWERLKAISPADFFQQNYEATFLEEAVGVFRRVREAVRPDCLSEPLPNHYYIGGLDLAQVRDFTVLTIFDRENHKQVFFDRFQKIPYTLQLDRIEKAAKKYNALLIVEINNIGLAIADELKARGVRVEDFKTVGTISKVLEKRGTKEGLIEKLSLDIENGNIFLAPIEVQLDELGAYTYNYTPSRNITYGAPEGLHDDCVIAIALANWGLGGKTREEIIQKKRLIPHRRKIFQYF
jgi:hypothetical protein